MRMDRQFEIAATQLIDTGKQLSAKGLVPATSGNFSIKLPSHDLAITISDVDKGNFQMQDIMRTDRNGESYDQRIPSTETLLHIQIYNRFPDANAVLHVHSLNSTVLSQISMPHITLENYELLKVFPGIKTHDTQINVPVFENNQWMASLAKLVDEYMDKDTGIFAYLIAGHGLYIWDHTIQHTLIQIETLEDLFSCELLKMRTA